MKEELVFEKCCLVPTIIPILLEERDRPTFAINNFFINVKILIRTVVLSACLQGSSELMNSLLDVGGRYFLKICVGGTVGSIPGRNSSTNMRYTVEKPTERNYTNGQAPFCSLWDETVGHNKSFDKD